MKLNINYGTLDTVVKVMNKFSFVTDRLGFAIARTKSKAEQELDPFRKQSDAIIMKYGHKSDQGYSIEPKDENWGQFIEERFKLIQEPVSIEIIQVTQEEFDAVDIFNKDCSAQDYELLEQLFVKRELPEEDKDENKDETQAV